MKNQIKSSIIIKKDSSMTIISQRNYFKSLNCKSKKKKETVHLHLTIFQTTL